MAIEFHDNRPFGWIRRQIAITRERRDVIRGDRCPQCWNDQFSEPKRDRRHCELCEFEWAVDRSWDMGEWFRPDW